MLPQLSNKQVLDNRHQFFDGYRQRRRADFLGQESDLFDVFEMLAINEQELEIERRRLEQEFNGSRVSFQEKSLQCAKQVSRQVLIEIMNEPFYCPFISTKPLKMTVLKHITESSQIQQFKSLMFLFVNATQHFLLRMTLISKSQVHIHSLRECQVMTLIKEEYPLLIQEGQDFILNQTEEIRFEKTRSLFFFRDRVVEGTLFLLYSDELDMQTKQDMISQTMSLVFQGTGNYQFAQLELPTFNLIVMKSFSFDSSKSLYLPIGLVPQNKINLPFVFVRENL